jgi:CubicO group peptidase (beta-lactamase class C family)
MLVVVVMMLAVVGVGYKALKALDEAYPWTDLNQDLRFMRLHDYDPKIDYYPDDHWHRAVPPEVIGWSSARLAEAREFSKSLDTDAVVIVENGVVVDAWGDLSKRYESRSMRKSYLSMLFGLAVAEGKIRLSATLEELGIDDVPPLTADERKATVADLLTARSGVYHAANYESRSMRERRPARGSHPPGRSWYYNNWDFNALGTIFERSTGMSIFDTFQGRIAAPLQMQDFRRADTTYHSGRFSVHPAYLFRMTPLDMARLGLLYLRGGNWQGRQIIPASWVKESTTSHVDTGRSRFSAGYGYMWWVGDDGYAAFGNYGQRLFVMPSRNLVIVHVVDAAKKGAEASRWVSSDDIYALLDKILAAKEILR